MAKHTYFITGTDTGVGKTIVSAAILEAAKSAGKRTLAMKPIASGCDQTPEGLRNEDALMLQAAITEKLPYDTINPIALKPAIAPHVAAQQAGKQVTAQRIVGFCRGMQIRPADLLLIAGVEHGAAIRPHLHPGHALDAPGDARAEWEFLHELVENVTGQNGFSTIEGLFNQMATEVGAFKAKDLTWAALGDDGITVDL